LILPACSVYSRDAGHEVVLAGVGWRPGATVSFGPQAAEVVDALAALVSGRFTEEE